MDDEKAMRNQSQRKEVMSKVRDVHPILGSKLRVPRTDFTGRDRTRKSGEDGIREA